MAFISLTQAARESTGNPGIHRGGRRLPDDALTVAVHQVKQKTGHIYALALGVYPKLAKAARLQRGDRVDVLFDHTDGTCLLVRNNDGQWTLSKKTKDIGKSLPVHMQATIKPGMPYFDFRDKMPTRIVDWSIDEETGGVVFQLPRHPKANGHGTGW